MQRRQVLVKSGEMYVASGGESIYTTLGSCVAFCAYDSKLKIGGMVHYLLPSPLPLPGQRQRHSGDTQKNPLNYGEHAIPALLAELKRMGAQRRNIEVSLFGAMSDGTTPIGQLNYECALDFIKRFGLRLAREKTLLPGGLRVRFETASGSYLVAVNKAGSALSAASAEKTEATRLLLLGASTGGTEALKTVIRALPADIPPVLIVQHMPREFTKAFSETLNTIGRIKAKEVKTAELIQPGCAYIAPGGKHIRLRMTNHKEMLVTVTDDPPVNLFKPSVDYLFNSVAALPEVARGARAALLTGMGDDGARGLLALRNAGALTIAQDEGTSTVFGMPKAAIEYDAASLVCRIEDVAASLVSRPKKKAG